MTQREMIDIVRAQLAVDLNCQEVDLLKPADTFVFAEYRENEGHRHFFDSKHHFEMLNMGGATVVSATEPILSYMKARLEGFTPKQAYGMEFVTEQSLYFLPDLARLVEQSFADGVEVEVVYDSDIHEFYKIEGFRNAIQYNPNHVRPDKIAVVARVEGEIAGMAGVSADCERLWQIGIDVMPQYRKYGLAAALVTKISTVTLQQGKIPYYGTATCNIASQRVAYKCGFNVAWSTTYGANFPGLISG